MAFVNRLLLAALAIGFVSHTSAQARLNLPLDTIALPPGFTIDMYTTLPVPNARTLVLSDDTSNGTIVYVSTNGLSNVYAVIDHNNDGIADSVVTVVSNLSAPLGLAYSNSSLWVATTPTIYRFDNVDALARAGKNFTTPHVVLAGLGMPSDHGNHYMVFGPDNNLYFNLGAPFNIGIPPAVGELNLYYASIAKMSPNGTNVSTFATGTRNIVGMQFHPTTGSLYFSCNGRDQIGDTDNGVTQNTPDDYIAYAPIAGLNFGYPYCHRQGSGDPSLRPAGPGIPYPDPEFPPPPVANASFAAKQGFCEVYMTPPVQVVGPHVATLGMKFYTGDMFPSDYNMSIINAQHGSWDRNVPLGYRVMVLNLGEDGLAQNYSALAEGWLLPNGTVWGRPADVLPMPDGSLLVSDDTAGALYRITYSQALANVATVNVTADSANFTDGVLPELQIAPAPYISQENPSGIASTQTTG